MDDDVGSLAKPTQSPGPSTAPTQPPGPTFQPTTPISQSFQIMPGAYPSPYMYPNPFMLSFPSPMTGWNAWPGLSPFLITPSQPPINRPSSHEGSQKVPSRSSFFYHSPSPYGIQTPPPWVMQTLSHSLFYQCGSSSQHPQPDPLPEEPQSPPEQPQPSSKAELMRNPTRNYRRPPCGTNFDLYYCSKRASTWEFVSIILLTVHPS
ncbi:hypothetical protein PVK06_039250 [Gossypium arboreum]|uniref:Uncharacterized protein n=1 Tax=Gossypium arboreum TaxID=29729 RepID=A0ABR0N345_GOSAR|nr:hypothetical protein PVK06_039250 [Gossypium arboreum]